MPEVDKVESKILAVDRKSLVKGAFQEVTQQNAIDDPFYITKPYNPDDLYQMRGDYTVYEQMRMDDQISACLQLKKDLMLGAGYVIKEGDDGQEEIIEDLVKVLEEDVEKPFLDSIEEILDSMDMGFSITERIYKKREDQTLTIGSLRTRHPAPWLINADKFGNISTYEQQSSDSGNLIIKPSDKKLIHVINRPKYQNPYGTSDIRFCYDPYISKKEAIKFLNIFLETAASPKPVGKYPVNAQPGIAATLSNLLASFQAKTSLVLPKELEVEFLEASTNGEAFHKAINLFNMLIGRALLVPDLMGFTGSETAGGSFALGKEQINVQFKHIERKRQALEDIINKDILAPIIMWNWGEVEKPPRFKFLPMREEDSEKNAKLFLEAVKGNLYKPTDDEINHLRKLIQFPEGEIERVEARPFPDGMATPGRFQGEKPDEDNRELPPNKPDKKASEDEKKFAQEQEGKSQAEKRADFPKIKNFMQSNVDQFMGTMRPMIDEMFNDIGDQIAKKKILDKKELGRASQLKFKKLKSVNLMLQKNLKDVHKAGQSSAREELLSPKLFAESLPLTDDEFLRVVNDEAFAFVGDFNDTQQKAIRVRLASAIKDNEPLSRVLADLDELKDKSEIQIERFVRTATTEIFNKGRLAFFDSTEIVTGYEYSAVLDDRTTLVCAGLHGKKFKKGTQPVPPLHFNCRSLLLPITQFEPFDPDKTVGGTVKVGRNETPVNIPKKSIDKHIEENKGQGFSTQ